ncbi:MAG TPA: sigma-70 family RNA polymerase sigma factor [Solirubrobacteraceae bacterium]|jgi:DNA-directed RNA polymerase specialized sigma24 family protein|nr:sigma-70 family RNA polymerase sigma factor [Solirubrobacteraceae bacterium]
MSPLPLRRYRAERLLGEQFEQLRAGVIAGVAARLRAVGVRLDDGDIEASYSQAWQGLYASVLEGAEVANPEAWLALVTYRRALDEHRARVRVKRVPVDPAGNRVDAALAASACFGRDLADELDDRVRLRQLFEGLRARLNTREQQAATLCYLHGLSRAEAASRMGVSEARMQKLMDGRGGHAPGVARKVGALVETIGAGRWCDEQGSLMRGFAYGVLDPSGERYRLAELHHAECPACRAYVLSLRGLAAVLPPFPSLLAPLLGSGVVGAAAASGSGAAGSATSAGGAQLGSGASASALSASGAAGAGAAGATGGGWWLAGSLGAKLAAGCLVALGVGAGCVALGGRAHDGGGHRHRHSSIVSPTAARERASAAATSTIGEETSVREPGTDAQTQATAAPVAPSAQAAREFGPEQAAGASGGGSDPGTGAGRAAARSPARPTSVGDEPVATSARASAGADSERAASDGASAAEREFAPG